MASLPSLLPSKPAIQDTTSAPNEINQPLGKATTPEASVTLPLVCSGRPVSSCSAFDSTPIFICALDQCYRLLPTHKALMAHRKKDHQSEDDAQIITWNSPTGGSGGSQPQS